MNPLSRVDIFKGLDRATQDALTGRLSRLTLPRNALVFAEGDRADALYVIVSGEVKVFVSGSEGREITLITLGTGQYFGELALVDGQHRSASVRALEACEFAVMARDDLLDFLDQHPERYKVLFVQFAKRIRHLTNLTRSLALLDVYGRVVNTLNDMARQYDGSRVVGKRVTHQEIANRVGASREMVSRIMKDLTAGGYIGKESGKLVIRNPLPSAW